MTPWGLVNCKVFGPQGPSLTNRMTEWVTYGSVGGVGSDPGPYPAPNLRRALQLSHPGFFDIGFAADARCRRRSVILFGGKCEHHRDMRIPGLRSSYEKVGGIVSFGRLLDKIRLNAQGKLPEGWFTGPQVGADRRCVSFLHLTYEALAERVLQGGTDTEVLAWCFQHGRQPGAEEIEMWNEFSTKRGWRDNSTEALEVAKREAGLEHRSDIQTWFDFQDADEERKRHNKDAEPG